MALDKQKIKEFFTFRKVGEKGSAPAVEMMTASTGNYEVNLVPAIKVEMIHKQKIRNLVMFISIVVCAASVGVVGILGIVKASQDITMSGQDEKLEARSNELTSQSNLTEILTIQEQLNKISEIEDKKMVLSRVFSLLGILLPSGEDKISLSELTADLANTTLSFEAQADAGKEPFIDYRVLESFKKNVTKVKYDYGRYVTKDGTEIPSRCIKEVDDNGNPYVDGETGGIYAMWRRDTESCRVGQEADKSQGNTSVTPSLNSNLSLNSTLVNPNQGTEVVLTEEDTKDIQIWRTPRFDEWVKAGYMGLDGQIDGVEHFESRCITYTGKEDNGKTTWSASNDCLLTEDEVTVVDSANARNTEGNLVLKFNASVKINPEVFAYNNKHMMGIGPFGQNVTDSYVQTDNVFVAPARECSYGDTDCLNNTKNSTGE